jgi:hypothetical protein
MRLFCYRLICYSPSDMRKVGSRFSKKIIGGVFFGIALVLSYLFFERPFFLPYLLRRSM